MDQKVCAIVGAGEGLGQSLAAAFATKGFDIALLSRSEKGSAAAAEAARRANPLTKVQFFAADAGKPQTVEDALARLVRETGGVEVLIYNVRGDLRPKPPLAIEYSELREILEIEVVGALAAAKAVMPGMIEKAGGTMIFSSATAAFRRVGGKSALRDRQVWAPRARAESGEGVRKGRRSRRPHPARLCPRCADRPQANGREIRSEVCRVHGRRRSNLSVGLRAAEVGVEQRGRAPSLHRGVDVLKRP
jgi:NAD(P)-dependent dehydrogenase (short-subunit alcohol dehydrogenase family)